MLSNDISKAQNPIMARIAKKQLSSHIKTNKTCKGRQRFCFLEDPRQLGRQCWMASRTRKCPPREMRSLTESGWEAWSDEKAGALGAKGRSHIQEANHKECPCQLVPGLIPLRGGKKILRKSTRRAGMDHDGHKGGLVRPWA